MINRLGAGEGIHNGRVAARIGLALTAAMLLVAMLFASPSSGASGLVLAQPSGSSSPSEPVPTGPSIAFLNPSVMPVSVGPPDTADPPVIADKPENLEQEVIKCDAITHVPKRDCSIVDAICFTPAIYEERRPVAVVANHAPS